jgi:hypothetical protein
MAGDGDLVDFLVPKTIDDWRDLIGRGERFRVCGGGSSDLWLSESQVPRVSTSEFSQVLEYRPDDLIIRVGAGLLLGELVDLVAKDGLCLPIMRDRGWLGYPGKTVGGLVGLGLPHYGIGSVRDWVVGMKFLTGSGEIVDSGANVVKSVAGFDLHRMLVGSRSELGVILEVALRLYPLKMMPDRESLQAIEGDCWVHRVPRSFECQQGVRSPQQELIWADRQLELPPHGWAIGPGGRYVGRRDAVAERFRANLKNVLDPNGVFEKGWKQ